MNIPLPENTTEIVEIVEAGQITPEELAEKRTVEQNVSVPAPKSVSITLPQGMAKTMENRGRWADHTT